MTRINDARAPHINIEPPVVKETPIAADDSAASAKTSAPRDKLSSGNKGLLDTLESAAQRQARGRAGRRTPFMPKAEAALLVTKMAGSLAAEKAAELIAHTAKSATVAAAASTTATVLAGLSAGGYAVLGLKVGLDQIIAAHDKGHQFGIRAKASVGLGRVLKLAAQQPGLSIDQLREAVTAKAQQDYSSERAANRRLRGGTERPKDVRQLNAEFEGYRKGMEAGLQLIGKLSTAQRRGLGQAAMTRTSATTATSALDKLARQATGADSIHAARGAAH